ncbi:unnamed protein product, partial [Allacma fusca]
AEGYVWENIPTVWASCKKRVGRWRWNH